MILFRIALSPLKIVLLAARLMGYSRFAVFVLGVFVGLAVAPSTGAEFRARVRELIEGKDPAPTAAL